MQEMRVLIFSNDYREKRGYQPVRLELPAGRKNSGCSAACACERDRLQPGIRRLAVFPYRTVRSAEGQPFGRSEPFGISDPGDG